MSFLKKLGTILANVATTAIGIGPIITPLLGNKAQGVTNAISTVTNDLTAIAGLVVQTEVALQGKTGAEKLEAAVNLVGPYIKTSQLVSGKKIADPVLLEKGIQEVTQGLVDILNSVHEDSVKTEVQKA